MLLIIAIFYALQGEFAFLLFCFEGCKSVSYTHLTLPTILLV